MDAGHASEVNKAVIYAEPLTIKTAVVTLPVPEPGVGEVLVRLQFSGVCHTDYAFCMGAFPGAPPAQKGQIGGHEGVGTVVSHGPGVKLPAIGSVVGIKFAASACLSCVECLAGSETSCTQMQVSGYTVPGTFQQFCVAPAAYVTLIPEGLDLAQAAPLMCSGVSVYAALKRLGLSNGEWVVVSGAGGGLGHLAVQYAKVLGGRVLAIDSNAKKSFCLGLGAEVFLDFRQSGSDANLAEKIKTITNGGATLALICTSSSKAYQQALFWLRVRGTLVCLGIPEDDALLPANLVQMVNSELSITGTTPHSVGDYARQLAHLSAATKSGNRLEAV